MKAKELLSIANPEDLAEKQYNAIVKETEQLFKDIVELMKAHEFKGLRKMISNSPAGDCMGGDNSYISFSNIIGLYKDGNCECDSDIGNVIDKLDGLSSCFTVSI